MFLNRGIFRRREKDWIFIILRSVTIGELNCTICRHGVEYCRKAKGENWPLKFSLKTVSN